MYQRTLLALACVSAIAALAWFNSADPKTNALKNWDKIAADVYRTKTAPHTYAIIDKEKVLLVDATVAPDVIDELGAKSFEAVLLTHHHRDAVAFAAEYRRKGISVRASKESEEWLVPEKVTQFWKDSLPLRNSRTAYFVVPEGVEGIEYTISDGTKFAFGNWQITAVATPGHSRDHFAYHCESTGDKKEPSFLFCGDAFSMNGKLWTPFTTDWDHWTEIGLKPTAASLRKMAKLEPSALCPAHGDIIDKDAVKALNDTAIVVDEAAFMKSYERFTKNRLGDAPKYDFLVPKEQIASAGDKPWAKVSDHLWITGNTYVLKATNGDGIFVLDPWGQRSADQVEKLRKDQQLGPVEVVSFSHAHYDHFDGIHVLNGRERCEVWGLDLVAIPLKDPFLVRAPFLDPRPIKFTKELKDGETAAWGGYTFQFHHLPGQSWYTSGIEVTIDGKRCFFTADNFFHQDQFSGTGGWMGLNRSFPAVYGTSAKKVLDIAPEWVLAEHGGPYVFHKEDYQRRVSWGEAAGKAADALCISGNHQRDWTPLRVTVEPVLQQAKPGTEVTIRVIVEGSGRPNDTTTVTLRGRGIFPDVVETFAAQKGLRSKDMKFRLPRDMKAGQHVFIASIQDFEGIDSADPYFAVSVQTP
jgi:glyoxylase-like metal-dependent hydrolase (beta-lactamase superfamily II)